MRRWVLPVVSMLAAVSIAAAAGCRAESPAGPARATDDTARRNHAPPTPPPSARRVPGPTAATHNRAAQPAPQRSERPRVESVESVESVDGWTGDPRIDSTNLSTLLDDVRHLHARHGGSYRRLLRDVFHRVRAATWGRQLWELAQEFSPNGGEPLMSSGNETRLTLLTNAYVAPGGLAFDLQARLPLYQQQWGCSPGPLSIMGVPVVELIASPPPREPMALDPEQFEAGSLLRAVVEHEETRRVARSFTYVRLVRVGYTFRHSRWIEFAPPTLEVGIVFDADPEERVARVRVVGETVSRLDHFAGPEFRRRSVRVVDEQFDDAIAPPDVYLDGGWWQGTPAEIRANQQRLGWEPR